MASTATHPTWGRGRGHAWSDQPAAQRPQGTRANPSSPPLPPLHPLRLQGNKGHCGTGTNAHGDTGHRRESFQRRRFLQPQAAPRQSLQKATSFTGTQRPLAGRPGCSDKAMGSARAAEGGGLVPSVPSRVAEGAVVHGTRLHRLDRGVGYGTDHGSVRFVFVLDSTGLSTVSRPMRSDN